MPKGTVSLTVLRDRMTAANLSAYIEERDASCTAPTPCEWTGKGESAGGRCVTEAPSDGLPWHHRTTVAAATRKLRRAGWVAAGMATQTVHDLFPEEEF